MSPAQQQLVAIVLVLVSTAWLLRHLWRKRSATTCSSCSAPQQPLPTPRGTGVRPAALRVLR